MHTNLLFHVEWARVAEGRPSLGGERARRRRRGRRGPAAAPRGPGWYPSGVETDGYLMADVKKNKFSEVLKVTSVSESLTGSVSQSVSEVVTKEEGES